MTLSADSAERIIMLVEAAKTNDSLISVRELVPMLPEKATEEDLKEAFALSPSLRSRLEVRSGYVTEKKPDGIAAQLVIAETQSRLRAQSNLRFATDFLPMVGSSSTRLLGVSGSTSYSSSSKSSDLDFFSVTRTGRLWVQMVRYLMLSRAYRLAGHTDPQICFSCVMDASYAEKEFMTIRDPLFARDALQMSVLSGGKFYRRLLRKADWISTVYPSLYEDRTRTDYDSEETEKAQVLDRILNGILFALLGSYIRTKSFIRNRKLANQGRLEEEFLVKLGPDHLIYESRRYLALRRVYSKANPIGSENGGPSSPVNTD